MPDTKLVLGGVTRLEDARYAAAMGIDFIAYDLSESLTRFIQRDSATEITEWIMGPEPIGVFTNERIEYITETAQRVGCKWIRVASRPSLETTSTLRSAGFRVIGSFEVHHDASLEHIHAMLEPYMDHVDAFRLDTSSTSLWGSGTESINWRALREIAGSLPVLLSGNFTAESGLQAVEQVRPHAIELVGCLEESPGVKDFDKMGAFFDIWNARQSAE